MNTRKEDILIIAKHALHYADLFIDQCDNWLPEEGKHNTPDEGKRCKSEINKKRVNLRSKFLQLIRKITYY